MGVVCNTNIEPIFSDECLNDSLLKINNNFLNLENSICELRQRVDSQVQVRTFFYYGPNATTKPNSGMDDGDITRPSNITIQAFVNSPTELNLPTISKPKDVVYVVYQKTGFLSIDNFNITPGQILRASGIVSPGKPKGLKFGIWYDVNDYYSADASCDGAIGRLGTITLNFRTAPGGAATPFVYRASGTGIGFFNFLRYDDTYVEWDANNVYFKEGRGSNVVVKRTQARPFKGRETAQFRFDVSGAIFAKTVTGIPKIYKPLSSVTTAAYKQDDADTITQFSPTFIIWRLTCQNSMFYTVDTGFPKFSRAQQSTSGNATTWNAPQNWSQY